MARISPPSMAAACTTPAPDAAPVPLDEEILRVHTARRLVAHQGHWWSDCRDASVNKNNCNEDLPMKRLGGLILAFGALLGLAVSIYNYFMPVGFLSPLSSTDGTLGALVPIGSTVLLLIAGLVLASGTRSKGLIILFVVGSFLDILGTAFAGMLLDSTPLLVAMAIAAVGWLMWVFGPRSAPAAVRA